MVTAATTNEWKSIFIELRVINLAMSLIGILLINFTMFSIKR